MVQVLKTSHPIARKEHRCMFCGEKITIGQKYDRSTCLYEGIYDWVAHEECVEVAHKLDMYDDCDDNGLGEEQFRECINDYVHVNHYNDKLDDIAEDWQVSHYEQVKKILEELNNE